MSQWRWMLIILFFRWRLWSYREVNTVSKLTQKRSSRAHFWTQAINSQVCSSNHCSLGNTGGQGSLAFCSPCGHKDWDMTEWLNWLENSNRKSAYPACFTLWALQLLIWFCSVMIFNIENFNTNCSKKEIKPYINFHFYISKESACNAGDLGLTPGSGRSVWEGNGNPFHYSCLENSMDREAWWATVYGVAKNQTLLSN